MFTTSTVAVLLIRFACPYFVQHDSATLRVFVDSSIATPAATVSIILRPHRFLPMRAIVCVAGVELPDLSLSHGPVGSVLGFDHTPYDKRVRSRWHELLYPYPLRAYKHR